MLKKNAKQKIEERPDFLRYEDDHDILECRPTGWEVTLKEKDTGAIFDYGQYATREEAVREFHNQIEEQQEIEEDATDEIEDHLDDGKDIDDLKIEVEEEKEKDLEDLEIEEV